MNANSLRDGDLIEDTVAKKPAVRSARRNGSPCTRDGSRGSRQDRRRRPRRGDKYDLSERNFRGVR